MNIILFVGIVQKTKKVAILIKIKLVLIASHHQDTNVIKKIYFNQYAGNAHQMNQKGVILIILKLVKHVTRHPCTDVTELIYLIQFV